jgi:hypothetical protein
VAQARLAKLSQLRQCGSEGLECCGAHGDIGPWRGLSQCHWYRDRRLWCGGGCGGGTRSSNLRQPIRNRRRRRHHAVVEEQVGPPAFGTPRRLCRMLVHRPHQLRRVVQVRLGPARAGRIGAAIAGRAGQSVIDQEAVLVGHEVAIPGVAGRNRRFAQRHRLRQRQPESFGAMQ